MAMLPLNTFPINGPPGYTGGVFVIGNNIGAGGNIAAAAGNGKNQGAVLLNPQALGGELGSSGLFADGGSDGVGGLDAPGTLDNNSGQNSGSDPAPPSCMTVCQLNEAICDWPYYDQPFCDPCNQLSELSPTDSQWSGGPSGTDFTGLLA